MDSNFSFNFIDLSLHRLMISHGRKLQTTHWFQHSNLMEQFSRTQIGYGRVFQLSVCCHGCFDKHILPTNGHMEDRGRSKIFWGACTHFFSFHFASVWNTVHERKKKCRHEDTNQLTFQHVHLFLHSFRLRVSACRMYAILNETEIDAESFSSLNLRHDMI